MPNDEYGEYDDEAPVDTGLVSATVTALPIAAARPPSERPPAAVKPLSASSPAGAPIPVQQMPDGWTLHKVASLVSDVAQNMYETPYLLKKHGLTERQYEKLQKNEFFQRALEAEVITWSGANSIQKRLMLEAAIGAEAAMPTLAARMQNKNEDLVAVVALMKLFAEMAGVTGAKAAAGGPQSFGERFKIVINIGTETVKLDANPSVNVNQVIEHTPS